MANYAMLEALFIHVRRRLQKWMGLTAPLLVASNIKRLKEQQRTFIQMRAILKAVDDSGKKGDVHTSFKGE
nr:hypothetical protein CFP56_66611 [Quercus suber]